MNTPQIEGTAFSETICRMTKEVRMIMTKEQFEQAITEWLVRNIPQFRNMPLEFEWGNDSRLEVIAVRETEERK